MRFYQPLLMLQCKEVICVIRHLQRLHWHFGNWRSLACWHWCLSSSCQHALCRLLLSFFPLYIASLATIRIFLGSIRASTYGTFSRCQCTSAFSSNYFTCTLEVRDMWCSDPTTLYKCIFCLSSPFGGIFSFPDIFGRLQLGGFKAHPYRHVLLMLHDIPWCFFFPSTSQLLLLFSSWVVVKLMLVHLEFKRGCQRYVCSSIGVHMDLYVRHVKSPTVYKPIITPWMCGVASLPSESCAYMP